MNYQLKEDIVHKIAITICSEQDYIAYLKVKAMEQYSKNKRFASLINSENGTSHLKWFMKQWEEKKRTEANIKSLF